MVTRTLFAGPERRRAAAPRHHEPRLDPSGVGEREEGEGDEGELDRRGDALVALEAAGERRLVRHAGICSRRGRRHRFPKTGGATRFVALSVSLARAR